MKAKRMPQVKENSRQRGRVFTVGCARPRAQQCPHAAARGEFLSPFGLGRLLRLGTVNATRFRRFARRSCPTGTIENSPPFQRWGCGAGEGVKSRQGRQKCSGHGRDSFAPGGAWGHAVTAYPPLKRWAILAVSPDEDVQIWWHRLETNAPAAKGKSLVHAPGHDETETRNQQQMRTKKEAAFSGGFVK